jgi:hypothetical protein
METYEVKFWACWKLQSVCTITVLRRLRPIGNKVTEHQHVRNISEFSVME